MLVDVTGSATFNVIHGPVTTIFHYCSCNGDNHPC